MSNFAIRTIYVVIMHVVFACVYLHDRLYAPGFFPVHAGRETRPTEQS